MASIFPTADDAFLHPKGEAFLTPPNSPLGQALAGYAEGLECAFPLDTLWASIDAQLDADVIAASQENVLQQHTALLSADDALWDTYVDAPEQLEEGLGQKLEVLLPSWPKAQQAIGQRQALLHALKCYSQRTEAACTFVANLSTLLTQTPPHSNLIRLPLWTRSAVAIAAVAAFWVLMLDPTALVSQNTMASAYKEPSLLATASAPSVESYVITYCEDTSLTSDPLSDEAMLDSSQVVMMGCGSVN